MASSLAFVVVEIVVVVVVEFVVVGTVFVVWILQCFLSFLTCLKANFIRLQADSRNSTSSVRLMNLIFDLSWHVLAKLSG